MALTIPPWLLAFRAFLTKLTDALLVGRKAGAWDVQNGPRIQSFSHEPQALLNPITAVKESIKGKIVEAGLKNIERRIDTPEERKILIEGIHVPGLPARYTWMLAAIAGLASGLLEAVHRVGLASLVDHTRIEWIQMVLAATDWGSMFNALSAFLTTKMAFWTKQDSHNASAVIPADVVRVVGEVKV